MEVVIYARYSSKKQNETSIEAQLKECYEFCRKNNYIVIGEYIDEALTGKNDNRLQFQKMMKDSWQKKFQGIIVYKLDRFARNRYDSAIYKSKLKKNGVRVYSAIENIGDDASGILMESVLEGMAEYYSVELGQKVDRNMMLNAEKGYFNGGKVPFGFDVETIQLNGYKKRKLIINKDLQPIVRYIFEMKSVDTKNKDIIDYLKSNGIKNNNGKDFNKDSLQTMFNNKRYIGTTTYNDKEYPNRLPKMIEEELFYKVQEVLNKNKHLSAKNKAKEEYILTSKLFCAECKVSMTGCSGTSKTGVVYSYYVCNNRKKGQCQKKYISKHIIEEVVIKICLELLTKKNIDKISKVVYNKFRDGDNNSSIKFLEKEINRLNMNIEKLMIALESGENIDMINQRLSLRREELSQKKMDLVKESAKLNNLTEEHINFFLSQLKNGNIKDIKYRKALIRIFVNKIYLYDDNKLEIVFNVGKEPLIISKEFLEDISTNLKNESSSSINVLGSPYICNLKRE